MLLGKAWIHWYAYPQLFAFTFHFWERHGPSYMTALGYFHLLYTNAFGKGMNQLTWILSASCLNFWDEAWWFLLLRVFWTIVFIFIVIFAKFWPIYLPAFFTCLLNSVTFTELWTTSFIKSTGVSISDSVSHNGVQVLSIPKLLLACSQDWPCNLQTIVSWEA